MPVSPRISTGVSRQPSVCGAGDWECPAVAGGAYERGIGTMPRNNSEDAVSAREASAGYPPAGVYGLGARAAR